MTKYSVSSKLSIQALPLFPCVCSPEGRSIVGRYVCEYPGFQRIFFFLSILMARGEAASTRYFLEPG